MKHSADMAFDVESAQESTESDLTGGEEITVDRTALSGAIAAAKAIEKGNKTDEAWETFLGAINEAELVYADEFATQEQVTAAAAALGRAMAAFNNSADKETEGGQDETFVIGKEYTVPAELVKEDGSSSMAAGYFEKTATVVWDGTSYQVSFAVTAAGLPYINGIANDDGSVVSLGNGLYRVTVSSLDSWIPLTFDLTTPMGAMTQEAFLRLDTTSLPGSTGEEQKKPEVVNPGTDNTTNNNNNNTTNNEIVAGFQVGHTYQVPIAFLKHNSSETSMAAQYFGSTALVRPQSDGTFKVSFSATTEGLSHIISLAYNGATISQSGSQFTLTTAAVSTDTVLPISMTIKEMQEMGGGAQTADMHLYLSQATDLGTGQDNLTASSTNLAQTSDSTPVTGIAGIAAVAAAALAGAGVMLRRRTRDMK